jgi:Asp-tRNA(Asn)/Glu-tRNA(Gln) amidotransferase A subunit family amidase
MATQISKLTRRQILGVLTASGIGTEFFRRSAASLISTMDEFSVDSIKQAEWITGLELTDEQREEILSKVADRGRQLEGLRETSLSYDVPMAIEFAPTSGIPQLAQLKRVAVPMEPEEIVLPGSDEEIAFLSVSQLSNLIRTKLLTSMRLTSIYLDRLKKYGGMLRCVVNLTEELAIKQATRADEEIATGLYRGALHGIPWGAKDLIAVEGYPTTWGIPHHENRELPNTATVARRLAEAGAVLVAKLSLGALAQGDQWFGGKTRSPWNPRIGAHGSSAGSASATVAGLVGFSLGSETLGSILSPAIRCGASALRPTFGRVSRDGCMPLSWSMDKIGPICRSIEDCALVFDAIHGADGKDSTAGNYPFQWPSRAEIAGTKIGYAKRGSESVDEREDLSLLRSLGCELVEIELPKNIPFGALFSIIDVEAASVFDDLLRAGHTEGFNSWDESFRSAQYVSAVDYVRIQRYRTLLMQQFEASITGVDFFVNMRDLVYTNFTGHPSVVLPIGYRDREDSRSPRPIVLSGHLNDDERLLKLANQVQALITAHDDHPSLDPWLEKFASETLD